MPCYGPIRVAIRRKSGLAGAPRVRDFQKVPCGHCLGCRAEQRRQWAVRMMHEAQMHEHTWFVTLTYDDNALPEDGTLYPADTRNFVRSLRKEYPKGTFSYFLCGEYGDSTQRPHYHAVLFGADFPDRYLFDDRAGIPVFKSALLDRKWRKGFTEFSTVSFGAFSYVAGYVQKKAIVRDYPDIYTRVRPETGELIDVHPEFARMSRNPAIGSRWLEQYWTDVYPRDYVVVDGHKAKPPRYYDKWLEKHYPAVWMEVHEKRWNPDYDDSKYTTAARAANHEARMRLRPPKGKL